MEKRIALEKRGRPEDEITELILDNCRSTNIEGLTDNFTSLKILSLINVGLVTLKNFPKLPNLRKLELSDNRISNGLCHLTNCPKLTHLNLSGNKIKEYADLEPLKELVNLVVLDLFNNEVTGLAEYRDSIFNMIPSLKYLDGFDREEIEAISDDDDDEGQTMTESDEDDSDDDNVSLADVYNDDLEEDNSSWNEADAEDEYDYHDEEGSDLEDDESVEEDYEDAPAPEKPASVAEAEEPESESRGTKRKLEGNDG